MKKINWFLLTILSVATILRLPYLNTHMPALYGDEIAIGYNAYSILKTGRDEFGKFMPLQFQSWGDQKNPVYIYAVTLVQFFTGPTAAAVRIPSALAGLLAVYLTYLLVRKLKLGEGTALTAAFLLAVTPWHIHISRGGYEANLALTLGLASVYLLLSWFEERRQKQLVGSVLLLVLACYTYYTTKLFAPMLLTLVWAWSLWGKSWKKDIKPFVLYFGLTAVLAIPALYLAFFANGQARFAAINIFHDPLTVNRVIRARNFFTNPDSLLAKVAENKVTYYISDFTTYYLDNFSGQFLFVGGDSNVRYGLANHGMLYLIDAPIIAMGIILLYRKNRRAWLFLILWWLLAPIPTALVGKAYGLRSLAILPIPQIFAAYTLSVWYTWAKKSKVQLWLLALFGILYLFSMTNWLLRYIYQYPTYGRYWYDSAVKEEIEYAKARESQYDEIILSGAYGKTDIYYAYYLGIDPREYWASQANKTTIDGVSATHFGKYYFADLRPKGGVEDMHLPDKTLVIADPQFWYHEDQILAKDDGRVLFQVYAIPTIGERHGQKP